MKLYTWHEAIWTRLWATGRERLPHALLLCGHSGVGKRDFALRCAQALLCGSPDSQHNPCGHCSSCNSFQQSAHPDFRLLVPSAESALDDDTAGDVNSGKGKKLSEAITVDQVRGLADFVSLTSHQSGQRVVLIAPAEQLNGNAANALLKMLAHARPIAADPSRRQRAKVRSGHCRFPHGQVRPTVPPRSRPNSHQHSYILG